MNVEELNVDEEIMRNILTENLGVRKVFLKWVSNGH